MLVVLFSYFPPVNDERFGGGAISVWNSIKSIVLHTNYDVIIVYRSGDAYEILPKWFTSRGGVEVCNVKCSQELVSVVERSEPDLFHGVDSFCKKAILHCKKHKIPTVYDVHSVECWPVTVAHRLSSPITKNWRMFLANRRDRKVAQLADIVVRPSEAAINTAKNNYDLKPQKLAKSFNSVDKNFFFPRIDKKLTMKIVNAGRITFDRHFKMLVDIYLILKESLPSITLDIAGDGHDREALESWVKSEGIKGVSFLGVLTRQELGEFYRSGDILVNTSEMESFGNVVAEAMGSGLPVVCFAVGSLPELVSDGEHGFLNNFGDINAHVEAVVRLYKNPELIKTLGDNGHRKTCELFSELNKAKDLCAIYEDLIEQKGS